MILSEYTGTGIKTKQRGRKSKACRKRSQMATRKPSKSVLAKRAAAREAALSKVSPIVIPTPVIPKFTPIPEVTPVLKPKPVTTPVTVDIVPQSSVSSANISKLVGYGLLGSAAYAVLKK